MRIYRVPLILDETYRPVGGVLSVKQAAYLLGALVACAGAYRVLPLGEVTWGVVAVIAVLGTALAFAKVPGSGLELDRYVYLMAKYGLTPKEYPYVRR